MVTIGIDAHKSSLAVALVDELGRELAAREFGNEPQAYRLHAWVLRLAPDKRRYGVESSGWVGRGIACFLLERGEAVVDVRGSLTERQRKRLRGQGKSDPRDALAIARVTAREQLPPVRFDSLARDLKLLCDCRAQLLAERIRTANRLHVDLVSLHLGYEQQIRTVGSSVQLCPRRTAARRRHPRPGRPRVAGSRRCADSTPSSMRDGWASGFVAGLSRSPQRPTFASSWQLS